MQRLGDAGLDGRRGTVGGLDVTHERVAPVRAPGDQSDGSGEFRIHDYVLRALRRPRERRVRDVQEASSCDSDEDNSR